MLPAEPLIILLRDWVATQTNIITLGPKWSMKRPRKGDKIVKTIRETDCTDERVALSQPKSSSIGLKNTLTATELMRKIRIQEAATIYQPGNSFGLPIRVVSSPPALLFSSSRMNQSYTKAVENAFFLMVRHE